MQTWNPKYETIGKKLASKRGRKRLRKQLGKMGYQKLKENTFLARMKHRGSPGNASY